MFVELHLICELSSKRTVGRHDTQKMGNCNVRTRSGQRACMNVSITITHRYSAEGGMLSSSLYCSDSEIRCSVQLKLELGNTEDRLSRTDRPRYQLAILANVKNDLDFQSTTSHGHDPHTCKKLRSKASRFKS